MKEIGCENEALILEALGREGAPENWEEPLRAHLQNCARCAELVNLFELFQEESQRLRAAAPLPEAGRVWWRALVAERQARAERALRPILMAEKVALAVAAGALIALLVFTGPRLAEQLPSAFSSALRAPFAMAWLVALSIAVGVLLVGGSFYALRNEK